MRRLKLKKHPVCDYLRTVIQDYLAETGQNLNWLSRQTRIDYQRLYRIERDETRSASFFETRTILKLIRPLDTEDALGKYFPDFMRLLRETRVAADPQEAETLLNGISYILTDPVRHHLYLRITDLKLTHDEIAQSFGDMGVGIFQELVDRGALTKNHDGRYTGAMDSINSLPDFLLKQEASQHLGMINLSDVGSRLDNLHKGLNLEGFRLGHTIVTKATEDLKQLMEDPRYHGDLLAVFSMIFGLANRKEES